MSKPDYDTTLARIAGNIAAGIVSNPDWRGASLMGRHDVDGVVEDALRIAFGIVERLKPGGRGADTP